MKLSKNTKKAGLALAGSVTGYLIAKQLGKKDNYLYILIGGFIGSCIGEELLQDKKQIT